MLEFAKKSLSKTDLLNNAIVNLYQYQRGPFQGVSYEARFL